MISRQRVTHAQLTLLDVLNSEVDIYIRFESDYQHTQCSHPGNSIHVYSADR